ncbi:AI-2E family transporter [Peptostreptococcus sp. MV1]|uniref:AI-2E family transporter n=1 Tax=Peptostreptococcus sp. MV1 TaxID=1219626 RepID=UPI001FA6DBCC|nr:AI-2E family transporter [Peptostreptococcus sp. MV1]
MVSTVAYIGHSTKNWKVLIDMKIDWNRKYTTIAVYAIIVIVFGISFCLSVMKFSRLSELTSTFISILKPFIVGFSLAYLLNFILEFLEGKFILKLLPNAGKKTRRYLSMIITYVLVTVFVFLFFKFIFPQVAESIVRLVTDFPNIVNQIYNYVDKFVRHIDLPRATRLAVNQKVNEIGKSAIDFATNFVPYLANFFLNIVKSIWNLILGIIISIYILADKEGFFHMCSKFIFAMFSKESSDNILKVTRLSNDIFGKFIIGKIIDSIIIAIITFIILTIVKMPYVILLTFIIGITNVIPFFGPFIGAIPSVLLVLMVDPIKALWLILIIFLIQQLDGNVIGPKILGDSIGISSFWILFSLLVAGKFFGIIGMVIGVPLFAVIYTMVGESVNNRLKKKGLIGSVENKNK